MQRTTFSEQKNIGMIRIWVKYHSSYGCIKFSCPEAKHNVHMQIQRGGGGGGGVVGGDRGGLDTPEKSQKYWFS